MNTSMKWFSIFCCTVFFFTACGKKDSDTAAVRGPKPGAALPVPEKPKPGADVRATVDLSKLTPEEKVKAEAEANQIVNLVAMLKEANAMYKNATDYLWNRKGAKAPHNIFDLTARILRDRYNFTNGYDLKDMPACKDNHYEIKHSDVGLVLNIATCSGDKRQQIFSLQNTSVSADQPKWTLTMLTENNPVLHYAVGRFLSCTGKTAADCKVATPSCEFVGDGKKVIKSLVCKNLGQDKDEKSTEYLKISTFTYDRTSPEGAKATGMFYSDLGVEKEKLDEGKDVPTRGQYSVKTSEPDSAAASSSTMEGAVPPESDVPPADAAATPAATSTPALPVPSDSGAAPSGANQPVHTKTGAAASTAAAASQEYPDASAAVAGGLEAAKKANAEAIKAGPTAVPTVVEAAQDGQE